MCCGMTIRLYGRSGSTHLTMPASRRSQGSGSKYGEAAHICHLQSVNLCEAANRAEALALKAEYAAQRANFKPDAQWMARRAEEQCKSCK